VSREVPISQGRGGEEMSSPPACIVITRLQLVFGRRGLVRNFEAHQSLIKVHGSEPLAVFFFFQNYQGSCGVRVWLLGSEIEGYVA